VKALVTTGKGGPEVLKIEERPAPEPRPGQVRIAVRAADVNFADILARVGLYPDAPKLPAVVGYEVAGEIESVGEGVDSGLSPGDRVVAGTRFNGYAELAVADARAVVPLPEGWSFEEGAAMPVNYATAYGCLVRYGSLREGERILVQAAAGGVGIAATQIAKIVGAEVFGTASARKHEAPAPRPEQQRDRPGGGLLRSLLNGRCPQSSLSFLIPAVGQWPAWSIGCVSPCSAQSAGMLSGWSSIP